MNEMIYLLKKEKWLTITGFFGIVLGILCQIYVVLFGGTIGLEGDLSKAVSFNIAVGMFLITTALLVSFANFSSRKLVAFRSFYIFATLFSCGIETIQHFRGIDPRFTKVGSLTDQILGGVFGLIALLMAVFYALLVVQFFKKGRLETERSGLILGIRYGLITTMLSFGAGIWISILQSRYTGEAGNIIWLHGLGFHGIQLLPLIALLLEKQGRFTGHRLIHYSGIMWTLLISLIALQTILGRSIMEVSFFLVLSLILVSMCVFILLIVTVEAVRQNARNTNLSKQG